VLGDLMGLISLKSLALIILAVGLVSVTFGYLDAYFGPYFPAILREAGYTLESIGALLSVLYIFRAIADLVALGVVVFISYHYGREYKLTMVSGPALIILLYLAELFGHLVGAAFYQIQTPWYPVFWVMLPQMVADYSYVLFSLIGVLAANYTRESKQNQTETRS